MSRIRRGFTVAAIALVSATGVFMAAGPQIAHAANTCSTSSPTLGRTDKYFSFDGAANSALLSIALFGTLSKSNPNTDCVFAQTEVQTFDGELMYPPDDFYLNYWVKVSGTWVPVDYYDSGSTNCPLEGCTAQAFGATMFSGNPGSSVTGVLNQDGPTLDGSVYVGGASYFYSYNTEYIANPAGAGGNVPDTNASAPNPTP
jgi:hypothetical protein